MALPPPLSAKDDKYVGYLFQNEIHVFFFIE
jgi:hypothetical protein